MFIEIQKGEVYNRVYLFNDEKTDRLIHKNWKMSFNKEIQD